MTNGEAIDVLNLVNRQARNQPHEFYEALDLAIKALEQPEDKEKEAYRRGFEIGKKIGARAERTMTIAYLEGKTIEEDKIEQMFKNGEIEAIPFLGETAEEEK